VRRVRELAQKFAQRADGQDDRARKCPEIGGLEIGAPGFALKAPPGGFIPNTARRARCESPPGDLLLPKPKTSAHQRW